MILTGQGLRVIVAVKPVDFRKGHDGLAAVVQSELGLEPHSGIIVVFRSKRADRIKVLTWDGGGLVLAYKRLEEGSFAWPPIRDGVMKLSAAQFGALFEGLELVSKYADHLPLYRQVQIFARSGVLLDSSTLAGWSGAAGYHLAPLTRRLAEIIQVSGHLFMDCPQEPWRQ